MDASLRRRIIRAFDYRCAICDASGFRVGLDVHHIVPRGLGGSGTRRDTPDNLIPLCRTCHEDVHKRRPRWTARLKSIAERYAERL